MNGDINKCGQCRQFTRTPDNTRDLCGAWEQPTTATRAACELFMLKNAYLAKRKSREIR
ncbi:hypothetical protein [Photobacterium nomapromontoriensis]|uniref:hypothetical protein n=1 Tax=Photobacterium nomapromontoriensis TaxID=2910237 RepID=UPI003D0D720C